MKGITPLLEAIAAKMQTDNGITVKPGSDIVVTPGGKWALFLALSADDNFRITADQLRQKVTPRTKALMVNSPNNPTGRVITQDELDAIVEVCLLYTSRCV